MHPSRDPGRLTLGQAAAIAGAATFEVARAVSCGDLPATTDADGRMTVSDADLRTWIDGTLAASREYDRRRLGTPWDLLPAAENGFKAKR